jgi:glycyl-tRNA synthetase beta subunit
MRFFSKPLSTEELSAVLEAVFDKPLSDEKFDSVIDAVLDQPLTKEQFAEVVSILESDTVSKEQVASAVDSIIENGVTEDQATELATSAKVLQSIDGDQAKEIFSTVDINAVTAEEASKLVKAVQDAPTEVRKALESEINIFQGAIDTYIPLGSNVPIGTRRAIIGASALAIFSAPLPVSRRN